MRRYRITRDSYGNYNVEVRYFFIPFLWWFIRGAGKDENKAREIVTILKQKPIYL